MLGKLQARLHVSWLIACFSAAVIGGIALSFWVNKPLVAGVPLLLIVISLMLVGLSHPRIISLILIIIAGLLVGLWRGGEIRSQTFAYQKFINHNVTLRGTVADDATHKNGQLGLKLNNVSINGASEGGQVWASTNSSLDLKRGERIKLSGKLSPGFGAFAASMDQAAILSARQPAHIDFTRQIRDKFADGLRRAVPEPEATLGLGYLTGQHNDLPDNLTKQLQLVGLIHLVIAGGYNVTILVRFARRRLAKVSKYLALSTAGSILLGITLMAGFTAPMARTAIVTGLSLWAWYFGRRLHPLVLLPTAAAVTALVDPAFVWGDVGWYMTFVAYGGLIILAPMIKETFWSDSRHSSFRQIMIDTLSVQIVTMPIMAFAFGQYSIYGLPANLLVLPLMSVTMLLSFIAGLGGMMLPANAAHIIGWPATVLLGYTDKITAWLANANGADAVAALTVTTMIFLYAAILIIIWSLWRRTRLNFRDINVIE